jgi:hypothetical protein
MMNERSRLLVTEILRSPEEGGTSCPKMREDMEKILEKDNDKKSFLNNLDN